MAASLGTRGNAHGAGFRRSGMMHPGRAPLPQKGGLARSTCSARRACLNPSLFNLLLSGTHLQRNDVRVSQRRRRKPVLLAPRQESAERGAIMTVLWKGSKASRFRYASRPRRPASVSKAGGGGNGCGCAHTGRRTWALLSLLSVREVCWESPAATPCSARAQGRGTKGTDALASPVAPGGLAVSSISCTQQLEWYKY